MRLVIFDVDGTLVDSQATILAAMGDAFAALGREPLPRARILSIVGLSLPVAVAELLPEEDAARQQLFEAAYKSGFAARRAAGAGETAAPFYPGALEAVATLETEGYLLAIATGKSRRGLTHLLEGHGLTHRFLSTQTADDAPSKPAPGMVLNCLAETGVEARDAVVIGDTEFDMAMGRAAGARALGVTWGYHPTDRLIGGGAEGVIECFADLPRSIAALWEAA